MQIDSFDILNTIQGGIIIIENKASSDQNYKYSLKEFVSFMSIAFALFCFILFIYWKGYADNLGINTNSMNISYKENV